MVRQSVSLEEIYSPVEAHLAPVVEIIHSLLKTENDLTAEVVRYFFSSRGKLLRPALTLLGAGMTSQTKPSKDLLRLAAAYEIFHSATLLHDDVIDSAAVRRNLPTVHEKWSPQVAVLVGDFLHHQALRVIYDLDRPDILALFLRTAGDVCDGEMLETRLRRNADMKEEDYLAIVQKKTASLLSCCLASGAALAGASDEQRQALERFGRGFGTAFQIVDDCLDFDGNQNEFGKTLGADFEAGVLTLPIIYLLQHEEPARAGRLRELIRSSGNGALQEVLAMLRSNGAMDYSYGRAMQFTREARLELKGFPEGPERRSLDLLLDYVLERTR
jgi:octaprenyl-diphosphate synthase